MMGRNWIPKYRVRCSECGWTGVRGMLASPCPKCGHAYPQRTDGRDFKGRLKADTEQG